MHVGGVVRDAHSLPNRIHRPIRRYSLATSIPRQRGTLCIGAHQQAVQCHGYLLHGRLGWPAEQVTANVRVGRFSQRSIRPSASDISSAEWEHAWAATCITGLVIRVSERAEPAQDNEWSCNPRLDRPATAQAG